MAMSVILEVLYRLPQDLAREARLSGQVTALGGRFDCREESEIPGVCNTVCLTYEFNDWEQAERAAAALRRQGEHVEGPQKYGD
jgi:hypothetical protein